MNNPSTPNDWWPREVAMHWRLGSSASSRTIVRFRGQHIWDKYFLSRIYMEYCPHGDLGSLFCKHAKVNWDQTLVQDEDGQSMDPIRIPIRAIWSFFEDLAEAACKMAYGRDPLDPASVPLDWQTIVRPARLADYHPPRRQTSQCLPRLTSHARRAWYPGTKLALLFRMITWRC
jgi:hypothetical protein